MTIIERHIVINAAHIENEQTNVVELISAKTNLSKSQIKSAIEKGALWRTRKNSTQRLRRVKKALKADDVLHFYYNESVLNQTTEPAILLADYQDYSFWYKPYGMLSQGSKWSDHCTIERWVQKHLTPERAVFVVHRLDKAATGIMVLAHSKKAAQLLSKLFEFHDLEKYYQIIVHGRLAQSAEPQVVTLPIDDKSAQSSFESLAYDEAHDLSLLKVKIETGRKHQIRKHAASLNLPVVGDRLHGDKTKHYPPELNLQLCSVELAFTCPFTDQPRQVTLPEHLYPDINRIKQYL